MKSAKDIQMKSLRPLSRAELEAKRLELVRELFAARQERAIGQLKQTHKMAQMRRAVARVNFLLAQSAS